MNLSDLHLKKTSLANKSTNTDGLPDVSHERAAEVAGQLDLVGMSQIEMPVLVCTSEGIQKQPAKLDAFVSLDDTDAKGIHMSRLYITLQEVLASEPLGLVTLKKILCDFVSGQQGLSRSAMVRVQYELPILRKALVSDQKGWRHYPVTLEARLRDGNQFEYILNYDIAYSSTCPCSAALARQLVREKFLEDFEGINEVSKAEVTQWLAKESSIVATPHAQRSIAQVKLKMNQAEFAPKMIDVIDLAEEALGTPVQAAVKRPDEQEFARRNGQNLMFCEDAARKLKKAFDQLTQVVDFHIRVEHQESLHPHNAVAETVKGVPLGFSV